MPITIQPTTLRYKDNNNVWQQVSCLKGEVNIDDTAGAGDTDKTWSADKLVSDICVEKGSRAGSMQTIPFELGNTSYQQTASGFGAFAEGIGAIASGSPSHAEGQETTASGPSGSHAEGYRTVASGMGSHAEGSLTTASASTSHAEGLSTIAAGTSSHVTGRFNVADSYDNLPEWQANTEYSVGDKVKVINGSYITGYACKTTNSDSTFDSSKWKSLEGVMNYAEIVGNGAINSSIITRSNARALDWSGNEYLAGDMYVNCNNDSTGGVKVATKNTAAPIIIDTAAGNVASFSDGADNLPLENLVVNIEPVQDLHGYDNPWPAGGGANLLNPGSNEEKYGVTKTVNSDGTIRFNGTATATADFYFNGTTVSGAALDIPDGVYHLYGTEGIETSEYSLFMIYIKDDTTYYANSKDHTAINWDSSVTGRLFFRVQAGVTIDVTLQLSFVSGSQEAWTPYSNICPITGWTGCTVIHSDDIVFDKNVDGIQQGSIVASNGNQTSSNLRVRTTYLDIKPDTTYTINCNFAYLYIHEYSTNAYTGYVANSGAWLTSPCSYTTKTTGKYLRIVMAEATPSGGAGTIEVSPSDFEYLNVLENGICSTYPVSWQTEAGTVYGGNYNVTTGLLTVTHGQIVSYNGETLPGEWISDRDVYEAGTTPTTGAQVVYALVEPLMYQLDGTQINTLLGNNCIWADTGDASVTYRADTELFVQKSIPSVPVQDVQVNGTSVLSQGVANVPVASTNNFGVIKFGNAANTGLKKNSSNNILIDCAGSSQIKAQTNYTMPITPYYQHESTFYGLAKAASDSTQSASSNAVGVYTDAAKIAIQKMLGIYEAPWELILEDTVTNATEAEYNITVDGNGEAFELTDVLLVLVTPKQDTQVVVGSYGRIYFYYDDSNYETAYIGAYTQNANTDARTSSVLITQENGLRKTQYAKNSSTGGEPSVFLHANTIPEANANGWIVVSDKRYYKKITIANIVGTAKFKVYGRRKWTA